MLANLKKLSFALLCLLCISVCSLAQQAHDLQHELDSVNIEIDFLRQRVNESNRRVKQIENKMATKRKEISQLTKQLAQLDEKQVQITEQVEKLKFEAAAQQSNLQDLLITYRSRLVQLHKIRQSTLVGSIFSAQNLNSFLNRFQMVKYLLENDKSLIDELNHGLESQRLAYRDLQTRQKQHETVAQEINEKQKSLNNQNASYKAMHSTVVLERKLFLTREKRLQTNRDRIEKQIQDIETQNTPAEIEAELGTPPTITPEEPMQLAETAPEAAKVINFAWPVSQHQITALEEISRNDNHALLIQTAIETEIKASGRGKVIYRGAIGGLGNVIILAHGRGFSTVYARLQEMWVGLGEIIDQGETIGRKVGQNDDVLHFEVRFGGRRQPPVTYLPQRQ